MVVHIHGGGFEIGLPASSLEVSVMAKYQEAGISYVSIGYRLIDRSPADLPAALRDLRETLAHIARAIQFVRHNAEEWNIDPNLMGCMGASAG